VKQLKVLEFFAGTKSISKTFEEHGHITYTIEWDKSHPDISRYDDVNKVTADEILRDFGRPDVIWASFDCTTFSMAGISHHRKKNEETGNLDAVSEYAKQCDIVDQHVLQLINELKPTYFYIENPRAGLRKMSWMKGIPRYTVTYCQYGEKYMKPTDIFTNHPNPKFKPPCKNGSPCHEAAPRGSRTGLQGIKGSKDRSIIPKELCEHIVKISEEVYIDSLYNECKTCKNLYSSFECDVCENFDMFNK
jgi:hypothetical protein